MREGRRSVQEAKMTKKLVGLGLALLALASLPGCVAYPAYPGYGYYGQLRHYSYPGGYYGRPYYHGGWGSYR